MLEAQSEAGVRPLDFRSCSDYTTFRAEVAEKAADLVFHFYPTPEHPARDYWERTFPEVLSEVAQHVFDATAPRLRAAYTPELSSWWLHAQGFAAVGDPDARIEHFYRELDRALEQTIVK